MRWRRQGQDVRATRDHEARPGAAAGRGVLETGSEDCVGMAAPRLRSKWTRGRVSGASCIRARGTAVFPSRVSASMELPLVEEGLDGLETGCEAASLPRIDCYGGSCACCGMRWRGGEGNSRPGRGWWDLWRRGGGGGGGGVSRRRRGGLRRLGVGLWIGSRLVLEEEGEEKEEEEELEMAVVIIDVAA